MLIIGCDFHTRYQQIAMLDERTGELVERRLEYENGEAHRFYRDLSRRPSSRKKEPDRRYGLEYLHCYFGYGWPARMAKAR